jgi:mannose/cellobiose epimerase-like protein (N-acyl-D-glucosamine 2-epimerase family)
MVIQIGKSPQFVILTLDWVRPPELGTPFMRATVTARQDDPKNWHMKRAAKMLLFLVALVCAFPASAQQLLPGTRWLAHLNNDLLPFWTTATAFGKPFGAFPSVRCNDRTLSCPEIGHPRSRWLVALSRQSYGYGVAFHLTGNRAYLDAMRAGINFIRQNAIDRTNGGMRTVQNILTGSWGPAPQRRNAQELAYGLLGMAFYYYLTRDADVLRDIIAVKNYIFEKYGAAPGALQRIPTLKTGTRNSNLTITSQLDQMNTYLVLLTPILPEPIQAEWKENLLRLSKILIDQFYSPIDKLFFPSANVPLLPDKMLTRTGTDFGHNAKALWMIRWAGLITGHNDLVTFAEDNARALLERAYIKDCGCWAEGLRPGRVLTMHQSWWSYAELDQLAGTLALHDPKFEFYLPKVYQYWFDHFVDKEYGEVWDFVDGNTHTPDRRRLKQGQWKNAYHSFEHALVGYIVAQQLQAKPVTVYYAFPDDTLPSFVQPYFYSGKIKANELQKDGQGRRIWKVTFSSVR